MSAISPGILSPPREILTPDEWRARGRAGRERVSHEEHAYWDAPSDRPGPVSVLEEQAKTRVPDLVPIRYGRMLTSAFACYRGAAAPMAWDLGHMPTPDLRVHCCVTRYYDALQPKKAVQRRRKEIRKAPRRTSLKAMTKFCDQVDGEHRIRPDHPVIVRFPIERNPEMLNELRSAVAQYQETLPADRREVLRRYYFGDFARKIVGVGSVGTEAFVLLLMGDRDDEPLFLQIKEAQESVLAPFAGPSEYEHQGERVARGQRMIQAAADEFPGWTRGVGTTGRASKDHYVRQLRDMKGSMDVPAMDRDQLTNPRPRLTGPLLPRARARPGRRSLTPRPGQGPGTAAGARATRRRRGRSRESWVPVGCGVRTSGRGAWLACALRYHDEYED